MKGLEEFISRERGFGISDPKRIKTEKSEPDAGTKMETVASELSGNAVPSESQIHKVLSFISLPPSAASNGTLRRSLRKYGNLSSTQLVFLDVLDCVDEIQHKRELMLEYHEAASDPRFPPAIARLYQARASRLGIEWLFLQEDRLPQLKSDFNVALTVAAPQPEPIPPAQTGVGDPVKDMLDISEAAKYSGVSTRTIRNWLESVDGNKPMIAGVTGKGRLTRIPKKSLTPYIKKVASKNPVKRN